MRVITESTKGITSQCTYRCAVLPDSVGIALIDAGHTASQCTYRCVVLPDFFGPLWGGYEFIVSMHLQVRGAP